jgi:hypothetical protein
MRKFFANPAELIVIYFESRRVEKVVFLENDAVVNAVEPL